MILKNDQHHYRYQKFKEIYRKIIVIENLTYRPPLREGVLSGRELVAGTAKMILTS